MKKAVINKLKVTRRKASRYWKNYRKEKQKILKNKRYPLDIKRQLLEEKRYVTRQNISVAFEDYRGYKFGIVHHSPYKDFSLQRKKITTNTKQEFYKAKRGYNENNLDSQVNKILNQPGVKGVQLLFKVYDEETDLVRFVSDYITRLMFDRLESKNISMFDNLANKLKYGKSIQEFELKGIYIRIIYEKSKTGKAA